MDSDHQQSTAVVVDTEDLKTLARHNEDLQAHIKSLELQLIRKEGDVRRASEEHTLRKELHTINQLSQRKQSANDGGQQGRLLISEESVAQLISLENRIKLEDKKTQELTHQADLTADKLNEVEDQIVHRSNHIVEIKEATGWERDHCAARGYVNPINSYRNHQRIVAELEEKQRTLKVLSDKAMAKLENLTTEIEHHATVEQEADQARLRMKELNSYYDELVEKKKSLQRLLYKKEKILKETEQKDDHKAIRMLEGEKRVLHNELSKNREITTNNSKSILAQEVRLRQLELRLVAMNQFLQQVLPAITDEDLAIPEDLDANATEIPVDRFDALQRELAISRHTVIQRDGQLEALDAKVEQLEKKVNILHCAIVARTNTATQEAQEMEKEYSVISIHLDYMRSEFEQEQRKLLVENQDLRAKLGSLQDPTGARGYE
ncbi:Hypothetical protein, putative [Bodo saltans]|uniref:Uncharacterized protein n=1 Tax=Bodo saltans TaxID=75058 RepID=A0A0S4J5N8_BODSA|nr:Hypothetical protein, putative [Bodo saltans]|eukprot:CUG58342.1 Hypothetical protein, putative [Bodo saltans]